MCLLAVADGSGGPANLEAADLLSLLDQLRAGVMLAGPGGELLFANRTCRELLELGEAGAVERHFLDVLRLTKPYREQVAAVFLEAPGPQRRAPVRLEAPSGRHYWTEIEARPDPRAPDRRILYLYDVSEVHHLRRQLDERTHFQDLIGKSDAMRLVYEQITQLSQVDTTVLIRGETGAGKELVARALHFASHRKDRPFIPVNCAGLTESLIGSQLFGHKRGAFTGAISDQKGVFEAADGGTVFLDEIGDIPLTLQTSLLRVLQEREFTRLGDSVPRKVDVRFIAATSRTLSDEVAKGRFREDLLFRIRVARILLPPLRARREDIPLLVAFFLERARATTGRPVFEVSAATMSILMDYHWPGNVRELESAVEAGVIRCRGAVLLPADLPAEILYAQPAVEAPVIVPYSRADEQRRIFDALERARGNRTAAARLLGMGRATLYRKLRKHGLQER